MGLAEPSAPASLAKTTKMTEADDDASPLPVSVAPGGGALSPAREKKKRADADDNHNATADEINWRGRDLPSVGQDPLAAAAAAASAKISETAHRAAELTLGAVAPGTSTEDLVRASKEGLWSALSAARTLAAGAVAAAAQASDAAVEGTRQQYHAVVSAVEAAREAANASSSSSPDLDDFGPEDGSAVLGAFTCEFRDEVVSSSSSSSSSDFFPPAPRRIRGSLFVTSSSIQFLVSRAHQALGRAVHRAVSASAAEASAASLGSAAGASELGGFLGATLAAEDAERAAREAEAAAGLPRAGSVAVIPLAGIAKVVVTEESSRSGGGRSGGGGGGGQNVLVVSVKGVGDNTVTFAAFGAPSDADEALALVEHLMGEKE